MYGIGYLQRLGRAMMLPMTVLPAAAIFLMLARLPWDSFGWPQVPELLNAAGMAIFQFVPYVFAIGIALGMSNQTATAGMAALTGMFIFHIVTHTYDPNGVQPSMFAGAVIGILSAWAHDRFKSFQLPEFLQFLGGSRFVPLFMSVISLAFAWAMIGLGEGLRNWAASAGTLVYSAGGFGIFLYGFLHRILVAFGLHHLLNHLFWFQVGEYEGSNGAVYFGDLPRFFAGDPTAGIFMAGLYPTMMFALPAIAFAIIHEAREDLKPKTRKQFRAAALGSFLTGITEPVEFAFLFVAPYLFLVHALISGGIMWFVYELDIHHGFTFSAGVLEFLVNMPLAQRGWLLLPIGIAVGIVYYVMFRWSIRRFQLATPGREDATRLDDWAGDIPYRAPLILQALGGKENMIRLEACITRLRLTLDDDRKVDVQSLRHLGAAGVIRLGGGHVQVVFGTFSELIREEIYKHMQADIQQVQFHSPVQGRMIPLEEVDDPIFAQRLVGRGVAFIPDKGELVAPVQGKVIHIHPSLHAIGLLTKDGLEVLLHVGINTSHLEGKGFTSLVKMGDEVSPGQPLLKFHIPTLKQHAKSLATPMVITNSDIVKSWRFAPYKVVKKGQAAVMSVVVNEREKQGGGEMIKALGASQGIAIGKAFVLPHWEWELPDQKIDVADLAKEFDRLYEGIRRSKTEINQMKTELDEAVGSEEASIFDAHLAILEDPVFMNEIQGIIQRQYKVAEVAVKEAIDHFVTMFDLLDDEYMKERALDIKDVGNRLLKHLLGAPDIALPEDTQPFVLVVRELSPSQLVHLKPELVLGIVTMVGSPTSHSAIMARAFGIPMVMGVEGKLEKTIGTGDLLIIDGGTGMLQVDPTSEIVSRYTEMRKRQIAVREQLLTIAEVPSVTQDGVSLSLAANISSLKELEAALSNGAEGVGLFRTEFLYMDRSRFPSEEEQFEVYKSVAQKLGGESLIIRTLDIGGDKQLDYYELPEEENPFLGFRAIRFSLERKDLFKTQLRAILRASDYGDVQIMYPLITSIDEVREANEVLAEAKRELTEEGIAHRSDIKAGIMVEVPAAVAIADLLAEEVSFFSIGTNDLIQFTLAVDRMNEQISHMYEPYHPAILRMIRTVTNAAKAQGIPVSICGEIAGDVNALPIWLGLGIEELSLSAQAILPVKESMLRTRASDSRKLLEDMFRCKTAGEIRALANQFHAEAALAPGNVQRLL